jgi:hypothetical protein
MEEHWSVRGKPMVSVAGLICEQRLSAHEPIRKSETPDSPNSAFRTFHKKNVNFEKPTGGDMDAPAESSVSDPKRHSARKHFVKFFTSPTVKSTSN